MRKLAILLLLACAACTTRADGPVSQQATTPVAAGGAAAQPAAPGATPASGTLAQMQALIGKAECTSDSQCQVLPIGARACGGPAGFLAWSNTKTDAGELQGLAERYKAEQQASNQASGRMSTCIALTAPAVACRAGGCQLTDALPAR